MPYDETRNAYSSLPQSWAMIFAPLLCAWKTTTLDRRPFVFAQLRARVMSGDIEPLMTGFKPDPGEASGGQAHTHMANPTNTKRAKVLRAWGKQI